MLKKGCHLAPKPLSHHMMHNCISCLHPDPKLHYASCTQLSHLFYSTHLHIVCIVCTRTQFPKCFRTKTILHDAQLHLGQTDAKLHLASRHTDFRILGIENLSHIFQWKKSTSPSMMHNCISCPWMQNYTLHLTPSVSHSALSHIFECKKSTSGSIRLNCISPQIKPCIAGTAFCIFSPLLH